MNLILYKYENGHKFYGFITHEMPGVTFQELTEKYGLYLEQRKSSALEIVNPVLLLPLLGGPYLMILLSTNEYLKDGDTFPLPSDLKFEEELQIQVNNEGVNSGV